MVGRVRARRANGGRRKARGSRSDGGHAVMAVGPAHLNTRKANSCFSLAFSGWRETDVDSSFAGQRDRSSGFIVAPNLAAIFVLALVTASTHYRRARCVRP